MKKRIAFAIVVSAVACATAWGQAVPPQPPEPAQAPSAPLASSLPVNPDDLPPEESLPGEPAGVVQLPQIGAAASSFDAPPPAAISRPRRAPAPMEPARRAEITKLTRVMAGLHALRVLCKGPDDQLWRERMSTLLDLETKGQPELRESFVSVFNSGYEAEQSKRVSCPSNANQVEAGLAREGRRLALALAAWGTTSGPRASVASQTKTKP
jgi:uncharacterized protein (TIGR02301 family)